MFKPDFSLYDDHGQLFAIVEAKNKPHTTVQWASGLYKNWREDGLNHPPLFVVTPNNIYVWDHQHHNDEEMTPDITINASPILSKYLGEKESLAIKLSVEAFAILVEAWVSDMTNPSHSSLPNDPWLSSFAQKARDQRVVYQANL